MNLYVKAAILIVTIISIYLLKVTNDNNNLLEKAKIIHKNVITLDTHCDIDVKNFTESINYSKNIDTQCNIPKMEIGGLDVAW
ncbi:MAG: membrane dipeptidase, partial [Flavobacteriales bacterium]|nr:membrane dipeptidase [Flavobacteriales bacterium]